MAPRNDDRGSSSSDSGDDEEARKQMEEDVAGGEDGDFGEWEEDDEEARTTQCLFSGAQHASPTAALQHAADAFGFDLRAVYKAHSLDFYSTIQCLNYARAVAEKMGCKKAEAGATIGSAAAKAALEGIAKGEQRAEQYLMPTLPDDPILFEWEHFVG
eukprot:CAMPEP_0197576268 /NCGR_PEP_ID=MMETSP1326-20131121/1350_1 /TAXON_ID=1155430 /ORGANISM="Genus nov. species nov., Strain RCC2288" /LENGTH=157 /DNA_ID=CAMNT_0043139145 /DNA_START=79 /DNA_END=548 /DNA_ORIENTATION=+